MHNHIEFHRHVLHWDSAILSCANLSNTHVQNNTVLCFALQSFGSELSHVGNGVYDWSTFIADLLLWHYVHEQCESSEEEERRKQYCFTLQQCVYDFISTLLRDLDLECDDSDSLSLLPYLAGFTGLSMLTR